ncbi:hypothetical protein [Prevotella corporis]|uniref:hypothetical protein n=1 Tax=Prevotella corporis TaxID=28128 RepID=UPI0023F81135|nr:hypothetical protein [Prevotella corporis]
MNVENANKAWYLLKMKSCVENVLGLMESDTDFSVTVSVKEKGGKGRYVFLDKLGISDVKDVLNSMKERIEEKLEEL